MATDKTTKAETTDPCPSCGGKGYWDRICMDPNCDDDCDETSKCDRCGGTGKVPKPEAKS